MLVSEASVIVARAIKKDGVCDFGTGAAAVRKCRHCLLTWLKGQPARHGESCPMIAAEMVLANHLAAPTMNAADVFNNDIMGRVLIILLDKLGGEVELKENEVFQGKGMGVGMMPNKTRDGVVLSVMSQEECMGK